MFQIAKMIALLPQNTSAASVLYFKKFPFCPLGQTLECLSHLNLGFKKEWELAAKWVYAASLNIKLSMALGGWRSTLAAVSYPVPGWGADSQGVGHRPQIRSRVLTLLVAHRQVPNSARRSWQLGAD